ncbi:MAG: hypothetical protein ROZ64_13620 [Burkholderiaceae bacterium]|jgi:NaMN:DMB phosphoribosyltransferase|nr:hypothetical protein [Burkholderiaceae bacterium]
MLNKTEVPRLAVDEFAIARALDMSVHFLRKDRQTERRIPYFKIGGSVRYDLQRVREALARMEQGGQDLSRRSKRTTAAA